MVYYANMKPLITLVCLLVATVALAAREFVWKVSDGDTVWTVDESGRKRKIRMNKIDAPELNQPCGVESADFLASLILGKVVEVESAGQDRFGRSLDVLYLTDEEKRIEVNLELVKQGYAWHYSQMDDTPAYKAAQKEAEAAKRGLWKDGDAVNPYQFRKLDAPPATKEEYNRRKVAIPKKF